MRAPPQADKHPRTPPNICPGTCLTSKSVNGRLIENRHPPTRRESAWGEVCRSHLSHATPLQAKKLACPIETPTSSRSSRVSSEAVRSCAEIRAIRVRWVYRMFTHLGSPAPSGVKNWPVLGLRLDTRQSVRQVIFARILNSA